MYCTILSRKSNPYSYVPKGGSRVGISRKSILQIFALLAAVLLGMQYLLPLISPFLLGTLLALAAEPMVRFLHKKLRLPRPVGTAIGVSMAFCLLAMAVLVLCAFLLRQLRSLAGVLPDLEVTARSGLELVKNYLLALASHAPSGIRPILEENVSAFFSDGSSLLGKLTAWLLGLAGRLLSHVPDSALGLGTAILAAFLISARLPQIRRWLLKRLPKERLRALLATLKRLKTVLGGWLTAQCKLMGVTFCIAAGGLTLLRIPKSLLWALIVCLVDALPVLGSGTVLVPWALVCFLQGEGVRAIGILGTYAAAALTRSMLEPKLVGRHLGLDPLVTLAALYIGYRLWGVGGMLLAPMLTVALLQLVRPPEEPGRH